MLTRRIYQIKPYKEDLAAINKFMQSVPILGHEFAKDEKGLLYLIISYARVED